MRRRAPEQLELKARHPHPLHPGWGGPRAGAGRKRSARPSVPHRARPTHAARNPLHVTLRLAHSVAPLRTKAKLALVKESFRATHATHADFRVVHFSLQNTHLHLIVEAADARALSSGVRGLEIRIARRLNRAAARAGRVFTDRYHARPLRTPRELRNALGYVLLNARHHQRQPSRFARIIDPCSSGAVFDGWSRPIARLSAADSHEAGSTASAETWLLSTGWKRTERLISPDEFPGKLPKLS